MQADSDSSSDSDSEPEHTSMPHWTDPIRFRQWSSVPLAPELFTPEYHQWTLLDWVLHASARHRENIQLCEESVRVKQQIPLLESENETLHARLNDLRASHPSLFPEEAGTHSTKH